MKPQRAVQLSSVNSSNREVCSNAVFADNVAFHFEGVLDVSSGGRSRLRSLMKLIDMGQDNAYTFSQIVTSGRINEYIARVLNMIKDCWDIDVVYLTYLFLFLVCFDDCGQVRVTFPEKIIKQLIHHPAISYPKQIVKNSEIIMNMKSSSFKNKRKLILQAESSDSTSQDALMFPAGTATKEEQTCHISDSVQRYFARACPGLYILISGVAGPGSIQRVNAAIVNRLISSLATAAAASNENVHEQRVSSAPLSYDFSSKQSRRICAGGRTDPTSGAKEKLLRLQSDLQRDGVLDNLCRAIASTASTLIGHSVAPLYVMNELWLTLGIAESSCYGNFDIQHNLAGLSFNDATGNVVSLPKILMDLINWLLPMTSNNILNGEDRAHAPCGGHSQSDELRYLRRCDAALFPELKQLNLDIEFDVDVLCRPNSNTEYATTIDRSVKCKRGGPTVSKTCTINPSPPLSVNPVSSFQKKRKLSGTKILTAAEIRPLTDKSLSNSLADYQSSISLASLKTYDDEYECCSPPPDSMELPNITSHPDNFMSKETPVNSIELYTAALRVLLNLSHRCAKACLELYASGALESCIGALSMWFELRGVIKVSDPGKIDVQRQVYDCCLLLLNLVSNILEVIPAAFIENHLKIRVCDTISSSVSVTKETNDTSGFDLLYMPFEQSNVISRSPENKISLGGLLLKIINSESCDFISTMEQTENTNEITTMPIENSEKKTDDGICIESLVLSAHASLLLHVVVDDSFTKLCYTHNAFRGSTGEHDPELEDDVPLYERFDAFMSRHRTAENITIEELNNHWVTKQLPKESWWLPIRLLNAFAALQGKTGTGKMETIQPVLYALSRLDSSVSSDADTRFEG